MTFFRNLFFIALGALAYCVVMAIISLFRCEKQQ